MAEKLEKILDNRIYKKAAQVLFPAILLIFSLIHIREGITVTDTGYNYGNFTGFENLDDMWKFSTYLSGAIGALLTRLPLGQTMLGLNFYTGLFKVVTAVLAYVFSIRVCKMRREAVFLGEMAALGFCWCPTALLYNYLTYLFFFLGGAFLYLALVKEKNVFFIVAGIFLGINVFVRFPNVAEIALICAVWLIGFLYHRKFGKIVKDTLYCILGYVTGLGAVFLYIVCRYGISRYMDGIRELFAMTGEAQSYSPLVMLTDILKIYVQYSKWFFVGLLVLAAGFVLFGILPEKFKPVKMCVFVLAFLGMAFFFLKRGMFNLNYREYASMFGWGVLLIMACLLLAVYTVLSKQRSREEKVYAVIMAIVLLITPIGSNNHLYSAENNLFWAAPFFAHFIWQLLKEEKRGKILKRWPFFKLPLQMFMVMFAGAVLMQSVLFGGSFVFRDGMQMEKRDTRIEDNVVLKGMYTTQENGRNLQELNDYIKEAGGDEGEVILFGNVPSLGFYFQLKPALSSTWPDLASYSEDKFCAELNRLKENGKYPMIITSAKPSDVGEDENAGETLQKKNQYLREFMENCGYEQSFINEAFVVYRKK